MAEAKPLRVLSAPGIKRDGTTFDTDQYLDGLWCRWKAGKPQKMGGYRAITSDIPERAYGMHVFSLGGQQFVHLGGFTTLTQLVLDSLGNLTALNARIPVGFAASVNNLWQFDVMFDDVGSSVNFLIAHAGQNLADITSTVETPIYVGEVDLPAALTASAMGNQSGGILVLDPYLLTFGNSGKVQISPAGDPAAAAGNTAYVTGSKIVTGKKLRGSGAGPSGLLWSIDSLIRATFTDPTAGVFAFDTLTDKISILSSRGVIEEDGIYYWVGVDRFQMFSGVVQEIPNDQNKDWFFDNLNFAQRQKVFAFKIPRYNEIWWCFPFGNATECTHAVVLNTRGMFWYDTVLPGAGRTDGYFPQGYNRPHMVDNTLSSSPGYTLWQHETGTDQINGADIQPVRSFFKTSEISMLKGEDAQSNALRTALMEPDFKQTGPLVMTVEGRQNARSPERVSEQFTFQDTAATPEQETIPLKEVRRLMSFRFESNVAGGHYEMGRTMVHVAPDTGRTRS